MRDPNLQVSRKVGGKAPTKQADSRAPHSKSPDIPPELLSVLNEDGVPNLKELESKGILKMFLRSWNHPSAHEQFRTASARMKADGIDRKDGAAVKVWAEKQATAPAVEQKPVENSGPSVGRNEPCPCGSKKKYKKCCQGK